MQVPHTESLRFSVSLLEAITWFFVLLRNKWGNRMSYSYQGNQYFSIRSRWKEYFQIDETQQCIVRNSWQSGDWALDHPINGWNQSNKHPGEQWGWNTFPHEEESYTESRRKHQQHQSKISSLLSIGNWWVSLSIQLIWSAREQQIGIGRSWKYDLLQSNEAIISSSLLDSLSLSIGDLIRVTVNLSEYVMPQLEQLNATQFNQSEMYVD